MTKYPFPKIDLHLHLDGSFRTKTMYELACERGIELPGGTLESYEAYMIEHSNAESVNDYLQMFDWPTAVLQDKAALARVTKELIEDLAAYGVRYAEIRFAPQLHTHKELTQADAVEAVLEGRRQGLEENPGIHVNIINCMMSFGAETLNWDANMETVEVTKQFFSDDGVVAIDLAGAEGFVPLANFAPLFDKAKEYGLNIISHAGDSQDWRTVEDAIKVFGVSRVGHGHHIYENPELVRLAARKKIALEICPTSNIQCKTRASFPLHPAKNLLEMGVPVTINTDNMVMARTNLDIEYDHCLNEMDFGFRDLILVNINSAKASFMKEDLRQQILEELEMYL
ncbi:MAG: adenosine deaminase [Erysipelotrichaceae bacterium]|nr:adenosine deaminase [Erysipelotrichaceae bacterium]